nr:hypothetical protein [Tanacetum cinerariifolium]
ARLDEKVEAEEDNDQEEVKMKMYMKIVSDDEVTIDAIRLATKPPIIADWKIIKEGMISSYHIIGADGSSKRFSLMIQMLQNIDKEDMETLWKLVKAKYGNTRPKEAYERVLRGDLKVMFELDIESSPFRASDPSGAGAKLLALQGQLGRARQPREDARVPNHQDAPRDADSHI